MSQAKFDILCEIINSCESSEYNHSSDVVELSCSNVSEVKHKLVENFGPIADILGEKIFVQTNKFDFLFFWGKEEFCNNLDIKDPTVFEKDIAIYHFDSLNNRAFYAKKNAFIANKLAPDNYFFSNSEYYLRLLNFLKLQEHTEDGHFHFVDFFGWDNRLIVLTSAKKEGKLSITFSKKIPQLDEKTNYGFGIERFFNSFNKENKHLPKFIKSELFNTLYQTDKDRRMETFVQNLPNILEIAEQNFDVYLNDLSIENLKRDYLDYKDKYFGQLREILSKISSQVIALPISISATVIATNSVKDDFFIIVLVIIGFISYSIFAIFLLRLQKEELKDAKLRFNKDFLKLNDSPFFIKYTDEKAPFEVARQAVNQRIRIIGYSIVTYFLLLVITNSLLIAKMLTQITVPNYLLILIILGLIVVWVFTFFIQLRSK